MLRKITPDDAMDLLILRSDKKVMAHIDRPLAQSVDDTLKLILQVNDSFETHDGITWGITLRENPQSLIGTIGFWRIIKAHYRAEIGYLLHPGLQGKGLMQEAITAVIRYGFDTMNLHSVEANVNPDNIASIRLLDRNGFVREGYFKENYYSNGVFEDSAIYSLVHHLKA